ncbi:MAG: ribbon-helix-helix protein, CopG family [Clostridia bacterium]|nr:ribbon-helix-helix protein, CopG family [Clostridia bacterium]
MRPLKTKVSITIDEDVIEKIRRLAEDDDRSVSQFINIILKDYIRNQEDLDPV